MTRHDPGLVTPAVDIYENETEYLILSDLPGADPGSLALDLDQGTLTLQASRAGARTDYKRVFRLPDSIDAEAVRARLDAGVLRVHLPKRESLRPRRIQVSTA